MKRNILSVIALFCAFVSLQAGPITEKQAAGNARAFLFGKSLKKFANANLKTALPSDGIRPYYVFNIGENNGFVIVSGDDAAYPVLGYSHEGRFDADDIPDNMRAWLDGYAHDISLIQKRNLPARTEHETAADTWVNIPKIITSEWNQGHPYNKQCPKYEGDVENRPTGCVATAMAQVMYFHKWPVEKTAAVKEYSYVDVPSDGGDIVTRTVPGLEATVFNWDVMTDKYDSYSDVESEDEVAKLMKYAGHSVEMEYGDKMSGAFSESIPDALTNVFGYKNTARIVYPGNYASRDEWNETMYNELLENRPILYAGATKDGGGHQFICDGYENGFFHINWGWGGMSDGFFKLEVLDPNEHGTGGAGDGMAFSEYQSAVIGIQKPVEDDRLFVDNVSAETGSEVLIDVALVNSRRNYISMQFDMSLPEGIDIAYDESGMPMVYFSDSRSEKGDHKVSINKLSSGAYRFVAYSPSNAGITGTEGAVISIYAKIKNDMKADVYSVDVSNVVMCNDHFKSIAINGCAFDINVIERSYSVGDVNRDGVIDYADVNGIGAFILGKNSESFDAVLADADGDGVIDINDVMTVTDMILLNSGADRHIVPTEMDISDKAYISQADDGLCLVLKNNTVYKAMQMDMELPEGIEIKDIVPYDERISGFNTEFNKIADCTYRVLIYASDGRNIALNEGSLVKFINSKVYIDARIFNIVMVTSDLRKMNISVPTGIEAIGNDADIVNGIFTLEGVRVNTDRLTRGVYIKNGKKIIVR